MKRWIALALLSTACAVQAQTAPAPSPAATPAAPVSAAKKELVAKMIALQQPGIEQLARNVAERPALQTLQAAAQVLQSQVPTDRRDATAKSVEAEAKKFADEAYGVLRERVLKLAPAALGPILEEKFSEDELKQTIAWLESPASKKLTQVGQEMQTALVQKLVADSSPAIDPKLQAMRQKVQAILVAATASPAPASGASPAKAPAKATAPAAKASAK